MTAKRLSPDKKAIMAKAEEVGLRCYIDHAIKAWPRFSFVRMGDAMCVGECYTTRLAMAWIDGYRASVMYPPVLDYVDDPVLRARRAI